MAMMTGRVLLVCVLCVVWCGAGGVDAWPVCYCADGGMDDAGLARGMDDEVVFARRDCVSSAALRGVAAAVPAGEDGGVGASGTPNSDAGQPPVGDAGAGLKLSGSGAAPMASSSSATDTDAASSTPVLGAGGGGVGPKQQPAVVSDVQDDPPAGGIEAGEREEAGSACCGEEPSMSSVCFQPPQFSAGSATLTVEERDGQKGSASVTNIQSEWTQQERGGPHVLRTGESARRSPAPAPAEGQTAHATQPSEDSAEHAAAPSSGLTRDASNGDSQEQTPQPQTATDAEQSVPVVQGVPEWAQEDQGMW
ncbi:Mucin-associated surface protein [Trypanosoma cruzi]|nr:Mucin-associated surface protein [Trypanosoma cruzi]